MVNFISSTVTESYIIRKGEYVICRKFDEVLLACLESMEPLDLKQGNWNKIYIHIIIYQYNVISYRTLLDLRHLFGDGNLCVVYSPDKSLMKVTTK